MTLGRFFKTALKQGFGWLALFESAALAIFFADKLAAPSFLAFPVLFILFGTMVLKTVHVYAVGLAGRTGEDAIQLASAVILASSPLLLLGLIIVRHHLFLNDFDRGLVVTVLAGLGFLNLLFLTRLRRKYPRFRPTRRFWADHFGDLWSARRLSLFVFAVPLAVYCLWASGLVFPQQPLTGDEPHYLIITQSLLADGDLDLANNYQSGAYRIFYPGTLDAHSRPGKSGGQYSRHTPGLPLLLSPAYFLGEKTARLASALGRGPSFSVETIVFFVRSEVCLLGALLGLLFFRAMRNFLKDRKLALFAWAVFCFTGPLLFYSQLIYPEIPAALITLAIFINFVQRRDDRRLAFFLAGLGIGLLPWLGMKYVALAGASLVTVLAASSRAWRRDLSKVVVFLAPLAISGLAFLAYFLIIYGNLSFLSAYRGTSLSRAVMPGHFFHFRAVEFLRCGLGYLLDQRVGIIPYAPVYLLVIAGIIMAFRANRKESAWALFLFCAYGGFCSLAYYWGGYCPPGRTLLPVLWVPGLFTAAAMGPPLSDRLLSLRNTLVVLSLAISVTAMLDPGLLYHENLSFGLGDEGSTSHILTALSNGFINFKDSVPHLINQETLLQPPLLAWLALGTLITALTVKRRGRLSRQGNGPGMGKPAVWVLGFSLLSLVYIFLNVRLERGYALAEGGVVLFPQDQNSFPPELGGFWTKGESRATLLLKSQQPVEAIALTLQSPVQSRADIQVGKEKRVISWNQEKGTEKSVLFRSPVGFSWRGSYLYFVRIRSKAGFFPYREEKGSLDRRFLGSFVRLESKR